MFGVYIKFNIIIGVIFLNFWATLIKIIYDKWSLIGVIMVKFCIIFYNYVIKC